jgi:N6-adenosine-specific RNA methylase IME4
MKYQVMPDLTPIEYEALKADIAERGVLVPVEVDENGDLLDGHHRVRAWQELRADGVDLPDYPRMVRSGLTDEQKRNHARSLNVLRRQLSKEQRDAVMVDMRRDGMSYRQIGEAVGVSHTEVARTVAGVTNVTRVSGTDGKTYPAQQPKPEPPISMFVPGSTVVIEHAAAEAQVTQARQERNEQRRQERVERIKEISEGNTDLQTPRTYPVIYADPPWRYEHSRTDNRQIENHYPTLDLEQICILPVDQIAAPDAVLFLWTTSPKLAESMQVIDAWGFVYRTCMIWDKERMGMGYYARQQHELLLIATRGVLPVPEPENRPASIVRIRRDPEHSTKPIEFYELIERMYPEYERIELFARNKRDGWAAWGNQADD